MKKALIIVIALVLLISFVSCTEESPFAPGISEVVVQAYLFAGEPIDDIKITSTLLLGSEDTTAPPINDADVYLIKEGKQYNLVAVPGDSGYYHYSGSDLEVEEGDSFEINISYDGEISKAETVVPPPPENVEISDTILYISDDFFGWGPSDTNNIEITWDAVTSAMFYITVNNLETDPESIEMNGPFGDGSDAFRNFISTPTSSNSYQMRRMNFTHYGKHLIKIYRINQEYADLYISRTQDTRDLNEPLSNIENGLGIFSAFNSSDSIYFYVKKEE